VSRTVGLGTDPGTTKRQESRKLIRFVIQQTRFALLKNILQHHKRLPSTYEPEELNLGTRDNTICEHRPV
jgi:hypothetical protein